jgi:PAS domain S-box-containing protein
MWRYTPFIIPIILSGVLSVAIVAFAWRRRNMPGAIPLAALMFAVALWSFTYALELGSTDLPTSIFSAKLEYLGIVAAPVAWLTFGLQYTHRDRWLTSRSLALLILVPLITLFLTWTNEQHGLIWSTTSLSSDGTRAVLEVTHGGWFWVHTLYSYLCLLAGAALLISALLRSPHLYRRQAGAVLISAVAPWVGNALYVSDLTPWPGLDLTPFSFTITGLALAWSLLRFRLLDVVPVARDMLIERMSDGVVVLDAHNRVIDINAAVQKVLNCTASEVVGRAAEEVFARWYDLFMRYRDMTEVAEEIAIGEGADRQIMDVRLSALYDRRGQLTGRLIVWRDMTARAELEQALRESEEKLRVLFEILPVGVAIVDDQQAIVEMNPSLARILDLHPDAITHNQYADRTYIGPERQPLTANDIPSAQAIAEGRVVQDMEIGVITEQGRTIWTNVSAAPIPISGLGAVVVTTDITDWKLREERLHRLNERLLFHVQETPLGYIECDNNQRVVAWNHVAAQIFGYSAAEVLGQHVNDLIVPKHITPMIEQLQHELISRSGGTRSTNPNHTKDGREIICEWYNTPLLERDGSVSGWASLVQDITDQAQMETALRQANDTLQARIDELSTLSRITQTVVAQTDLSAILMAVAQQMTELLDASGTLIVLLSDDGNDLTFAADYDRDPTARNFVGTTISLRAVPFAAHMVLAHQSLLITQPQINALLTLFDASPKSERYECLLLVPLIMRGAVNGAIIVTCDQHKRSFIASEIRLAETVAGQIAGLIEHAKLLDVAERARAAAESANRAKSQFLGAVSHELRTPLNAILGYTQLLQYDAELAPQHQEALQIIRQSGDHLLTLITDLLDLAKIEAGKLELAEEPIQLAPFLGDIAAMARLWAQHKTLSFHFAVSPDAQMPALPTRVSGDPRRLRQVLLNLLGNAVKFTDSGGVSLIVGAVATGDDSDEPRIRFQIEDTGVGIAAADLATIFAPFQQAGDPNRRAAGAGLGLAICVDLLRLMGSELRVRSEPGAGSCFWFELALQAVPDDSNGAGTASHQLSRVDGTGLTALIVDDDRESRVLLRDLLAPLGFAVREAVNGRDGLALALERRPDVIIADVMMPELNGIDLTRTIRQSTQLGGTLIITTSANASDDQRRQCIAAGSHAFITKPIAIDELLDTLQQLLCGARVPLGIVTDADILDSAGQPLIPLPAKELSALLDLALIGDVRAILQRAEALVQRQPQFAPFVRTLQRLTKTFQLDAIHKLLQAYQSAGVGAAEDADADQYNYSDRR